MAKNKSTISKVVETVEGWVGIKPKSAPKSKAAKKSAKKKAPAKRTAKKVGRKKR